MPGQLFVGERQIEQSYKSSYRDLPLGTLRSLFYTNSKRLKWIKEVLEERGDIITEKIPEVKP